MAGFWRKCRTTFRWCRITAWFVILALLCAGIWLNRVGLPGFFKARLVDALHEDGVQLEFTRMRLSIEHGVVADNVRVGDAINTNTATLAAREVQLKLDFSALFHRRLKVDGITVRDGTVLLLASPTNTLALTNLQAALRFQANDTWTLDRFRAGFAGTLITVSGEVAHAPEIRDWTFFNAHRPAGTNAHPSALAQLLQQISNPLAQTRFVGQPQLNLFLAGDARDVHSISVRLDARVPDVQTPWFAAHDTELAARLTAPADAPVTTDPDWGFWTNLQPFRLEWTARTADLRLQKISVDSLAVGGQWSAPALSITKFSAQIGSGELNAGAGLNVATRTVTFTNVSSFDPHLFADWLTQKARAQLAQVLWTEPPALNLSASLVLPPWTNNATPDWRDEIAPTVRLGGDLSFSNAVVLGATLDFLRTHFSYQRQFWQLSRFELAQGRTRLDFDGDADETTRVFNGRLRGAIEAASARPFLTASNLTRNFDRFTFREPLAIDVAVAGDWSDWNTLGITGAAALTNFSLATFPEKHFDVDYLRAGFSYTNQFWKLSGLEFAQGRTRLHFDGESSDATENFLGRLNGNFDPETLRPFLIQTNAIRNLDHLSLEQPLVFNVDAAGNWRHLDTMMATGSVALTNFVIREQRADSVAGNFLYTNKTLEFLHPVLLRGGGQQLMKADSVTMDFRHGRIYFTNGFSTADPMYVVRCIGPKTAQILAPYQFPGLPVARVDGCSPMRDVKSPHDLEDADLTFVILQPTPFRWEKLRSPAMTGTIRWRGQNLLLTNIAAQVYGGTGTGNAYFDFRPRHYGADFHFAMTVTNVDLHLLAADLSSSPSNKLEGALSGTLMVTNANSETWRSWNGYGQAQLRNGLLWNIRIFGLASDAINLVSPGLGNSRATDASTRFGLTNGVIYSDSLEMHTATMRLQYSGTVDLQQNVNARVTAQLLRNAPVVGPVVSTVLWPVSKIFECQVTGRLEDPVVTPLWLPTPIQDMLHPFRSLEGMFNSPATPSP